MDVKIKTALVSVSDKSGIVEFAKALAEMGVKIISTGGTAKKLSDAGIDVIGIESVTGFPEMMNGRVKTLHPKIHGALLGLRDKSEHTAAMKQHGIEPIDLVCVNLYPFEQTIAKPDCTLAEAIENIDIGGPSMIRSAAKNHKFVTVVTQPEQYDKVIEEMRKNSGAVSEQMRSDFHIKVPLTINCRPAARYPLAVANCWKVVRVLASTICLMPMLLLSWSKNLMSPPPLLLSTSIRAVAQLMTILP